MQLRRSRDRNDPRLLCEQPGKRDLGRRCLFLLRELTDQIDHRLIRFPIVRVEAGDDVAEIALVELRVFADLAGEEALAQLTKWNEPDPEFLECRYDFGFRLSPPERVFALQCHDRLNFVRATYRLDPCFRKAEVLHLSLLN